MTRLYCVACGDVGDGDGGVGHRGVQPETGHGRGGGDGGEGEGGAGSVLVLPRPARLVVVPRTGGVTHSGGQRMSGVYQVSLNKSFQFRCVGEDLRQC